ncbi:MAG: hypothetical protein PGN08_07955 [Sphingomonas taxi]
MIVMSATVSAATVKPPLPPLGAPIPTGLEREGGGPARWVVTTFWNVTAAIAASAMATGAPVMSPLPIAIDKLALSQFAVGGIDQRVGEDRRSGRSLQLRHWEHSCSCRPG